MRLKVLQKCSFNFNLWSYFLCFCIVQLIKIAIAISGLTNMLQNFMDKYDQNLVKEALAYQTILFVFQ